jgi:DNA-binding transcriptional LysR family regulator
MGLDTMNPRKGRVGAEVARAAMRRRFEGPALRTDHAIVLTVELDYALWKDCSDDRTMWHKVQDLNAILIFASVAETGSFTAAARALALPKSTVSRKVLELEKRVGARLIQRTTRTLRLTDVGRVYFEHFARISRDADEADLAVQRMQATPRGVLRVTAPLSFRTPGRIAAEFVKRYPDVRIEVVCTDRNVDLVAEGFDVAIRAGPLTDSSLIARKVAMVKQVLVAAPAYLRRRGSPGAPLELQEHETIAFGAGPSPSVWSLHNAGESVDVRVRPRLAVNDVDWMHEAARRGIGIALLPEHVCREDLHAGRLRQVLTEWSSGEIPLHALYPTPRHLSRKVVTFIEMLRLGILEP